MIYPDCDMKRWECCDNSVVLANADYYYTKEQVDKKLDDIAISGSGVTVDEVQEIVDENLDDYYTKDEIDSGFTTVNNELDNKLDSSAYTPTDLSNYYDKTEVNTIIEDNEHTISRAINDLNDRKLDASAYTPTDLSQYWTSAETQNAINAATSGIPSSQTIEGLRNDVNTISGDVSNLYDTKLDASAYTPTDLSNYYTKQQTNQLLERKEGKLNFYSENTRELNGKIEIEGNSVEVKGNGIDLTTNEYSNANLNGSPIVNENRAYEIAEEYLDYTVQCSLDGESTGSGQWDSSGTFRFKLNSETPEYANTLPALNYSVTRYSGNTPDEFVISTSDGTGQHKKGNATLRGFEVEGYQKTLSAGTGIVISGNVISATGGGTGITIDQSLDSGSTNAVANSAITQAINAKADASNVYNKSEVNNLVSTKANVWCGSQTEFYALTNKDANTIFLVY